MFSLQCKVYTSSCGFQNCIQTRCMVIYRHNKNEAPIRECVKRSDVTTNRVRGCREYTLLGIWLLRAAGWLHTSAWRNQQKVPLNWRRKFLSFLYCTFIMFNNLKSQIYLIVKLSLILI